MEAVGSGRLHTGFPSWQATFPQRPAPKVPVSGEGQPSTLPIQLAPGWLFLVAPVQVAGPATMGVTAFLERQEGGHRLSGQANVLLAPGGARAAVPVGGRRWGAVGPGAQQPGQGQRFWESREGPLGHSPAQGLLNPWRELQPQTGVGQACLFLGKGQGQELVGRLLAEGLLRDRPWPLPGRQLHEDRLPPQPPAQRHGSQPGTRLRPLPSGSAQPRTRA